MLKTIVVVPCYNEAKRLKLDKFDECLRANSELGFLFVNDGSRDETLSMVKTFAGEHRQQVSVLDLSENQGKATAVRQGIAAAISHRPEYVGFWDADLATPLEEIPEFCSVLDKRDDINVVIGSRMPLLGHCIERTTSRRVLGRLFALVASRVLSLSVRDTQCGAKLFRVDSEINSIFAEEFHSKWILDVEILARLIARRRQFGGTPAKQLIYEKPLESWYDVAGSKLKAFDFVKAALELAVIYWRCLGPFRQPASTQQIEAVPWPLDGFAPAVPDLRVVTPERKAA